MKKLLGVTCAALLASAASADIVTLTFSGTVTEPGSGYDGDDFSAHFVYDTGRPFVDLYSSGNYATASGGPLYQDSSLSPLTSLSFSVNGQTGHPDLLTSYLGLVDWSTPWLEAQAYNLDYQLYFDVANPGFFSSPDFHQVADVDTSSFQLHQGLLITDSGRFHFNVTHVAMNVPAAVPEPSSWALMLGGFAVVGATMRRKRVNLSFA